MIEGSTASAPSTLFIVKQLEQAVRAHIEAAVRSEGLTAVQYAALTVLQQRDEMSSADLARNAFVRAQSMADMIGALDRRGFIERRIDPVNRRRMIIRLSRAGSAALARLEPKVAAVEHRMLKDLGSAQIAGLRSALVECRHSLATAPVPD